MNEDENEIELNSIPQIDLDFQPYAFGLSSIFAGKTHLAAGSFEQSNNNHIDIYCYDGNKFNKEVSTSVDFPPTRICFTPNATLNPIDHFISTDTRIKCWCLENQGIKLEYTIPITEKNDPLTCADWSGPDKSLIVVGSVDGTSTIVDINTQEIVTSIQTHDQPVYDVSFCPTSSTFITAGLDGSLRIFDLRDLNSSIIFYQTSLPIQRASVSPFKGYLVAAMAKNSTKLALVDSRKPGQPYSFCYGNESYITSFAWSRLSPSRIFLSHEDNCIYSCDIVEETFRNPSTKCGESNGYVQSMCIGPMMLAIAANRAIQFVQANESPPPMRSIQ